MDGLQRIESVSKVKRDLLNILKRVGEEDETIAITRNGEAVGVLMSMERYEALLETIEIIGDKKILRSLERSRRDFAGGKTVSHEEVWDDSRIS